MKTFELYYNIMLYLIITLCGIILCLVIIFGLKIFVLFMNNDSNENYSTSNMAKHTDVLPKSGYGSSNNGDDDDNNKDNNKDNEKKIEIDSMKNDIATIKKKR